MKRTVTALTVAAAILAIATCSYVVGQQTVGRYNATSLGEDSNALPRTLLITDTLKGQVRFCSVRKGRVRCAPWRDVLNEELF